MALINLRNALMAGKRTPTAKDYVQNGLVAMWDGIENAGWGVHDASATTWVDLSGNGHNLTMPSTGATWGADSLNMKNVSLNTDLPQVSRADFTIEVVFNPIDINTGAVLWLRNPSWVGGALLNWNAQGLCYYPWREIGRLGDFDDTLSASLSWSAARQKLFANGSLRATQTGTLDSRNVLSAVYVGEYNGAKSRDVTYYTIRLYSRALTAAEIAANYAIDKARFGLS